MIIGVIADSIPGANEAASALEQEGLATIEIFGLTKDHEQALKGEKYEALVIALKSGLESKDKAVTESVEALRFLVTCGTKHIFFKFTSSLNQNQVINTGDVITALQKELNSDFTAISPALPDIGYTVYQGFAFGREHLLQGDPIYRLFPESIKCGLLPHQSLQGDHTALHIWEHINNLKKHGYNSVLFDAVNDHDLIVQAQAVYTLPLLCGDTAFARAVGRAQVANALATGVQLQPHVLQGFPQGRMVMMAGSSMPQTLAQVQRYRKVASTHTVDIARCVGASSEMLAYISEVAKWYEAHKEEKLPPLIYVNMDPVEMKAINDKYGSVAVDIAIERFFYGLCGKLKSAGVTKFVAAGNEIGVQVAKALDVAGFYVGPCVINGVPWLKALHEDLYMVFKPSFSGDENFFFHTLQE